ncbi:DUF5753 domain-containing protein [Actinomadura fibrosa]|uniref:DUF5753 domain-containing protein n=1 Tax=Actinomadura fibrosa TaxID=111802 RepID=A0ABW2XRR7_9ACTN|nr:DUF5753 domain-containing protein [Actinomadura fibrosa]
MPSGLLAAQVSQQMSADEAPGPTMPRLLLGARLRRLRRQRGLHKRDAAAVVGSEARLAGLELGLIGTRLQEVVALCDLYRVEEHATRVALVELARQSHRPGWWLRHRRVIPGWYVPYLGAEQTASTIRCYTCQFIPDLLQTAEYAQAHIRLLHPQMPPARRRQLLQLRMERQQMLYRDEPTRLWAVLDEAALRRPVGAVRTMYDQLERLRDVCLLPQITIQVMPLAGGTPAVLGSPITLLRWSAGELADLVFLEQMNCGVYPDRPDDTELYRHGLNLLVAQALPPSESPEFLRTMINCL